MKLKLLIVAATAIMLTGCFDARYDVQLNGDGSGRATVDVILDKELSQTILKENKGKLPPQQQQSKLGKNAKQTQRIENGSIAVTQTLDFASLSEVTGSDMDIEVQKLGRSIIGIEKSRIRVRLTNGNANPNANDPNNPFGAKFITEMFKGREMRVTLHLPCAIDEANTVWSNGASYAPAIDKSWLKGSTVSWRFPMAAVMMMKAQDLTVTCSSFAGIKPGKTPKKK